MADLPVKGTFHLHLARVSIVLETIGKIYGINVFDYKLLLFAKNLEKHYILQLGEVKKNVKSVQNTNFEDDPDPPQYARAS